MDKKYVSCFFIDNSTVAGAGRALYDKRPDLSDCISLMHFITTTLLCDSIMIDGSSRCIPLTIYDEYSGKRVFTEPVAAVWTWEKYYPALAEISDITDCFLQRLYGFDEDKIVKYLLGVYSAYDISEVDLKNIPSTYLGDDYFDLEHIELLRENYKKETGKNIDDRMFKALLYTWRGIYYHELSRMTGFTYFANPQRSKFIEPFLQDGELIFDCNDYTLSKLCEVVRGPHYKLIQKYAREKAQNYKLKFFPFASYVLSQCKSDRREIIEITKKLRDRKDFVELRKLIGEYDSCYRDSNLKGLSEVKDRIEKSMKNFEKYMGIEKSYITIIPKLPVKGLEIKGSEDLGLKIDLPGLVHKEVFQKPAMSLLWDVGEDLIGGNAGAEKICQLHHLIGRKEEFDYILMDQSKIVRSAEDGSEYDLLKDGVYIEGTIAGPCEGNMHGYKNYRTLLDDNMRPANK